MLLTENFLGSEKTCALNKLFVCPNGESCKQIENSTTLGFCDCKVKYKRITEGGACVKLEDSDHSSLSTSDNINSESSSGNYKIFVHTHNYIQ